ncbi:hypothetical protein BVX99_00525 [bacterium F16]|nr:hypothetical protein BVX99_00525 [bacterium F16]
MYCAAKIGDFAKAVHYYEVVRARFSGWQSSESTDTQGHWAVAGRHWERQLQEVRTMLESSDHAQKEQLLKRLDNADKKVPKTADMKGIEQKSPVKAGQ